MSWWDKTKAFTDRVSEKVQDATIKTVEKTKEVTQRTKEVVKQKLGKTESVAELQALLEKRATEATTLAAIADLHRSWVSALNRRDGPSYSLLQVNENSTGSDVATSQSAPGEESVPDSGPGPSSSKDLTINTDTTSQIINVTVSESESESVGDAVSTKKAALKGRQLSFKQVFLRCNALQITLKTILSDDWLRKRYVQPAPEDQSSHSFYLYSLFQICLFCPPEIWGGLLRIGLQEAEILSATHISWLSEILGNALKLDWLDELYHTERKVMAVRAEGLRNEIRSVKTAFPSLSDEELEKQHKKKVSASQELVKLYKSLKTNMEDALAHRQKTLKRRDETMQNLLNSMDNYKGKLSTDQASSFQIREQLSKAMEEAGVALKGDLESIDGERDAIDQEIEELEIRKKNLKLEIEEVTQKLLDARVRQKEFMTKQDEKRNHMYSEKNNYKQMISEKDRLMLECHVGEQVLKQIQDVVNSSEEIRKNGLERQITELSKKREQFDAHFVEVLRDHCRYEDDRLTSIAEIAKSSCGRLIKLNDAADESVIYTTPGTGTITRADYLVRERHIFTKATHDLEIAWTDVLNFRRGHEDILMSSNVLKDSINRIETRYNHVKQHIAPGLELMVQSVPQQPSPANVVAPSFFPDSRVQTQSQTAAVQPPVNPPTKLIESQKSPSTNQSKSEESIKSVPPPPPPAPGPQSPPSPPAVTETVPVKESISTTASTEQSKSSEKNEEAAVVADTDVDETELENEEPGTPGAEKTSGNKSKKKKKKSGSDQKA